MNQAISKLQRMVADLPPDTPQSARLVIDYFLEVCLGYGQWVIDLQKTILLQDADIKRLRSTVEIQVKKIQELSRPRLVLPHD